MILIINLYQISIYSCIWANLVRVSLIFFNSDLFMFVSLHRLKIDEKGIKNLSSKVSWVIFGIVPKIAKGSKDFNLVP
jgi:hypothetical protein